jgi:hypothetical protein
MAAFIWTTWNIEHIAKHGITPAEAEWVVEHGSPIKMKDDKLIVRGQTRAGRYIQVIFVFQADVQGIDYTEVDLVETGDEDAMYVIHARPLEAEEKRNVKKRRKRK